MADTSDPKDIGDALRQLIGDAAKALILETTAELVERCPVDTGHARANFIPAVGEPVTTESGPGADGSLQAAGIAQVAAWKLGDGPLSITNNVPYIGRLIGGSSSQAPAGWDLEAVAQAEQTVESQYEVDIDITGGSGGLKASITPRVP